MAEIDSVFSIPRGCYTRTHQTVNHQVWPAASGGVLQKRKRRDGLEFEERARLRVDRQSRLISSREPPDTTNYSSWQA